MNIECGQPFVLGSSRRGFHYFYQAEKMEKDKCGPSILPRACVPYVEGFSFFLSRIFLHTSHGVMTQPDVAISITVKVELIPRSHSFGNYHPFICEFCG